MPSGTLARWHDGTTSRWHDACAPGPRQPHPGWAVRHAARQLVQLPGRLGGAGTGAHPTTAASAHRWCSVSAASTSCAAQRSILSLRRPTTHAPTIPAAGPVAWHPGGCPAGAPRQDGQRDTPGLPSQEAGYMVRSPAQRCHRRRRSASAVVPLPTPTGGHVSRGRAAVPMRWPDTLMTSSTRPVIQKRPSASRLQPSPVK